MSPENVWDYPRPPALAPCERRVRVVLGGVTLADSLSALRVLETSHPPTIYIPPADVALEHLVPAAGRGGWITSDVEGPFKGGRGTFGW